MSFDVPADRYDRYMGRYSRQLSAQMADLAGVSAGQRVLDVGCGPGALTTELVARLGEASVAAVDPSEPFVAAARERNPGVDVRRASAEQLPFEGGTFDAAIAQLVVHFMTNPVGGLTEMRRVTRAEGVVALRVAIHQERPAAGLRDVRASLVTASVEHASFDAWWELFTFGIGPAGGYLVSLDPERQAQLRETCRALVPSGAFVLAVRAWAARGLA